MSDRTRAMAALFIAFPLAASAQERSSRVYEGAVGAAPIVMELKGEGNDVYGQYFYRAKRFDIDFSSEREGGALQLKSRLTGDKLRLEPKVSGYAGELTTARGKTLPVELRTVRLPPADLPADLPSDLNLYEKMQLAGLALKTEKTETIAGRVISWRVEPASGNRMFRIESGYPAPVMEAINKTLAQIQWRNVSHYFGCVGEEGGSGVENMEVKNPYLSDAYVSFATMESWSCAGAAHPDFGSDGHSFDAKTGKEIELSEFIKFGKVPTERPDPWRDYRSKTFSPALVALLKRLYPIEMQKPKNEDDCDYTQAGVWDYPTWRLTEKGLYIGAIFGRAMRVCDNPEWSVIPWSVVEELRAKK